MMIVDEMFINSLAPTTTIDHHEHNDARWFIVELFHSHAVLSFTIQSFRPCMKQRRLPRPLKYLEEDLV
jgi:hypothetical protein